MTLVIALRVSGDSARMLKVASVFMSSLPRSTSWAGLVYILLEDLRRNGFGSEARAIACRNPVIPDDFCDSVWLTGIFGERVGRAVLATDVSTLEFPRKRSRFLVHF